ATDDCGNQNSCVQIITIVDTTPPDIFCPPDVTIECTEPSDPSNTGMATCDDACGGCAVDYMDTFVPGCGATGVITRTWTAMDDCGNMNSCVQTITIVDTTPPDITCPDPLTFQCVDDVPDCDPLDATATDACGDATVECLPDTDNGGSGCPGDPLIITRTYLATDECGNTETCEQLITVVDDTPPTITSCPGDAELECEIPYTFEVTAEDNCSEVTITCTFDVDVPGNVIITDLGNGQFTIEFTGSATVVVTCVATDECGNESDACVFTVFAVCEAEGCTPGFWKQPQHFQFWSAPYTPDTLFSDVFEDAFPGKSFLTVLSQPASAEPGPNSLNSLGRHTVAALLNAAAGGVDFNLTPGEVISLFNDAYPGTDADYLALKDFFAGLNELGCPIGSPVVNIAAGGGTAQASSGGPVPTVASGSTGPVASTPLSDGSDAPSSSAPDTGVLSPTDTAPSDDASPAKDDEIDPLVDEPETGPVVVHNDSILAPADSGGLVEVPGTYVQSAMGVLHVQVGGLIPVFSYDVVDVSDTASLDGVLLVELADGFLPKTGNEFVILTAGTVTGQFHSFAAPEIAADAMFEVAYTPSSVVLRVIPAPAPGDLDLDGAVDYEDLFQLLSVFGQADVAADLDGDGTVGVADLAILLEQWMP
ncbi:MAG: hypothetical protein ACYTGG_07545, partial [Planctomycetota bacterium]